MKYDGKDYQRPFKTSCDHLHELIKDNVVDDWWGMLLSVLLISGAFALGKWAKPMYAAYDETVHVHGTVVNSTTGVKDGNPTCFIAIAPDNAGYENIMEEVSFKDADQYKEGARVERDVLRRDVDPGFDHSKDKFISWLTVLILGMFLLGAGIGVWVFVPLAFNLLGFCFMCVACCTFWKDS